MFFGHFLNKNILILKGLPIDSFIMIICYKINNNLIGLIAFNIRLYVMMPNNFDSLFNKD